MPNQPPNLLIVHTDQQSSWTLSCYGGDGTRVDTPHIDRLAHEGAKFTHFYSNSAVCTPSRGCFLTGRYPHCHGAYANNVRLNNDEVTIAQCLTNAGYDTGYIGKWHLDGPTTPPGWVPPERGFGFADNCLMFNNTHPKSIIGDGGERPTMTHRVGDGEYTTDWLTDRAMEFVRRDRSVPFMLMVSFPDPHTPYSVREPYASQFTPDSVTVPETFRDTTVPAWIAQIRERYAYAFHNSIDDPDREQNLRRQKAAYCGSVKCIDDNVGRLLDCLAAAGQIDNTIVVYTTDHGDYMGEHGLFGKNCMYEAAYRIPLLIRWPDRVPAGTVVEEMMSTVDFQQTMLGLMGLPPLGREQGADLSPLLTGHTMNVSEEVHAHSQGFVRASLFTPQWNLGLVPQGKCVLYDRVTDPLERGNLYGDPAYNDIVVELTGRVVQHHEQVQSPAWMWLRILASAQRDLIKQGLRIDLYCER